MKDRLTQQWMPTTEGAFGEHGRKGDLGEKLACELLESQGFEYKHNPDNYHKQMQGKDIEILEDGQWVGIDVKTNIHNDQNNNVCVEYPTLFKSHAKYWLHINSQDHMNDFIMYEVEKMRSFIIRSKTRRVGRDNNLCWVNKKIARNLDRWL